MASDLSRFALGKKAAKDDARTLKLARYVSRDLLLKVPASPDNTKPVTEWGMLRNDVLGDCVPAGAGHAIQTWTANVGAERRVTDDEVVVSYETWGGYRPSDPSTDQGCVELDALNAWRRGTGPGGDTLAAYVAVDPMSAREVKLAIWLFGGVYSGFDLPRSAQTQTGKWSVRTGANGVAGTWGGHCMWIPAWHTGPVAVTWGELKPMTAGFLHRYCDELYALLSPDWFGTAGKAPNGFDLATLETDLQRLGAL